MSYYGINEILRCKDIPRTEIDFPNQRPFDNRFELLNPDDLYNCPEGALYITVIPKRNYVPKVLKNSCNDSGDFRNFPRESQLEYFGKFYI